MAIVKLPPAPANYDVAKIQSILNAIESIISTPVTNSRRVQRVTSSSFDVSGDSGILLVDYTATGAVTINIGNAMQWVGRAVVVMDSGGAAGANNITIHPPSGSNILVTTNGEAVTVSSDGTGWFVESRS